MGFLRLIYSALLKAHILQCLSSSAKGWSWVGIPPLLHGPLYPIVCSTAAKTEMALGVLERDFQLLQDRCIEVILSQLTQEEQIYSLKLPVRKKHFISEGLEDFQEDVALAVNNHNINLSHW